MTDNEMRDAAAFAPLTGGNGALLVAAVTGPDLAAHGYREDEYVASGTATAFRAVELPADGRFVVTSGERADFATRVLVRRPIEASRFNGVLVLEWLNVSSGTDAAPDYTYLADELVRSGYAWAGVSAQLAGVQTGAAAVVVSAEADAALRGLRDLDPARYGDLHHPGDAYCYDILTATARGLRAAMAGDPLEGLDVRCVLAIGQSQSAYALTTYVNAVQQHAAVVDGFLIHCRGGAAAPLGEPGCALDIARFRDNEPVRVRTDLSVPVLIVQTETDLLGHLKFLPARQPDTPLIRTWEVAGSSHADIRIIGQFESFLGCPDPVNRGQQIFVVRAALAHLTEWARGGPAPPSAPPLDVGVGPAFIVDDAGNARGGVRTPAVDAAVETLSGLAAPGASVICRLFGQTHPLPADQLPARYGDVNGYLAAYTAATDRAIADGFVLAADRDAVLADARSSAFD